MKTLDTHLGWLDADVDASDDLETKSPLSPEQLNILAGMVESTRAEMTQGRMIHDELQPSVEQVLGEILLPNHKDLAA
ncbi:MAG: hypothetical protein P1V18_04855 [Candidatus Gracilibacteria bacterium]|nr:hypothetical protein [Candidatus Gracilibacteria bacterium]